MSENDARENHVKVYRADIQAIEQNHFSDGNESVISKKRELVVIN